MHGILLQAWLFGSEIMKLRSQRHLCCPCPRQEPVVTTCSLDHIDCVADGDRDIV
eukprot:XP_001708151.1 Hypothetical protein GL50803_113454 [Giardia lamblia ATCC 50803]